MRILLLEDGSTLGTVGGGCVEADVVAAAREVLEDEVPRRLSFRLTESATGEAGLMCGGEIEVFVEAVGVPPLVLFGAGHVSQDVGAIAARAGFRVVVVDDRARFANAERFPEAGQVIAADAFEACFQRLRITASAYCVVVTRGHAMDLECLEHALLSPARYVGLIGSKVKVRNILRRLGREGRLGGVDLSRLHAPIGLDLGGGTQGEIAVAIVAEMVAHRRNGAAQATRKGLPLEEIEALVRTGRPTPAPSREDLRGTPQ
jgi:xanthine dehydrogenase accessory factor